MMAADHVEELVDHYRRGGLNIAISASALRLIFSMLRANPTERPILEDIKADPWFTL